MKKVKLLILASLFFVAAYYLGKLFTGLDVVEETAVRATIKERKKTAPLKLPEVHLEKSEGEELHSVVQKLIGLDSEVSLIERNNLVDDLSESILRKEDFKALYTFLKLNPTDERTQLVWHSLKNDLLVYLIDDGRYKESTGHVMLDIINDADQHEVMREYTLQYTSDYFEKHWLKLISKSLAKEENLELSTKDKELQTLFLNTMWDMLSSQEGPIAGTSLIKLNELSQNFSIIDSQRINDETEKLIINSSVPDSSRMAAFSVALENGMIDQKNHIKKYLLDEGQETVLRLSALYTVSEMEPESDFIELLHSNFIENDQADKRLRKAAELAIKKLNKTRG